MFGRRSELQGQGFTEKILCRTNSAWCSKMKKYVPMGGEGVKRGRWVLRGKVSWTSSRLHSTDVMRKLHIFLYMKMGQEVQMKGGEGGSLGPQGVCAAQS